MFYFVLVAQNAFATPPSLKIDCDVVDSTLQTQEQKDRVRVQLLNEQSGKFIYQPASERNQEPPASDWLSISRAESGSASIAKFSVSSSESVQLSLTLPTAQLREVSSGFEAKLVTSIPELSLNSEQDLRCKAGR